MILLLLAAILPHETDQERGFDFIHKFRMGLEVKLASAAAGAVRPRVRLF